MSTIAWHLTLNVSETVRDRLCSEGPPKGNDIWAIKRSRDRWRHVTLNGQTRDQSMWAERERSGKRPLTPTLRWLSDICCLHSIILLTFSTYYFRIRLIISQPVYLSLLVVTYWNLSTKTYTSRVSMTSVTYLYINHFNIIFVIYYLLSVVKTNA